MPGFESLKVFEMPLAGFLGFPPFALECVAVVAFLDTLGSRLKHRSRRVRRGVLAAATGLAVAGTLVVFAAADDTTVDSHYVPVEHLRVLPAADRRALAEAGLESPERLVRALSAEATLAEWSARTGLSVTALRRHRGRVRLVLHRGLGDDWARELESLGIETREDLAGWRPDTLAGALRASAAQAPHPFLERRARVWLERLPVRE